MATPLGVRSPEKPRVRTLDRDLAMAVAATEYERVNAMFASITADQWSRPTECPGWDVRAVAGHMLGMAQMIATLPELARQQLAAQSGARRTGLAMIDVLTGLQVAKNADLSPTDVIAAMRTVGPKAARRRRRIPGLIRRQTMPGTQTVGGAEERWTFGYLFDIILTRDPFMHRLDISRALDIAAPATAEHEGVIVDDVVREWAARHGRPYTLRLTGPAGGAWQEGDGDGDGEQITMDAFEFCRALCGRAPALGLLAHQVPF